MRQEALGLGFRHVESGPLVRSSYHARDQVPELDAARPRGSRGGPRRQRPGRLAASTARRPAPPDPPDGAPLSPGRRRRARDHVGHRAQQDIGQYKGLGVPRHDHGLPAAGPLVRGLSAALPLDGADPVVAPGGRALGLRGGRRRLPQEQRHDHRTALQPHEAKSRQRAGPGPHHQCSDPRDGPCPARGTRSSPA